MKQKMCTTLFPIFCDGSKIQIHMLHPNIIGISYYLLTSHRILFFCVIRSNLIVLFITDHIYKIVYNMSIRNSLFFQAIILACTTKLKGFKGETLDIFLAFCFKLPKIIFSVRKNND